MLFKIRGLRDGQEVVYYYDNLRNVLLDSDKNDVFQARDPQYESGEYEHAYCFNGTDTQYKVHRDLHELYIVPGLKCNFHCPHCPQAELDKNSIPEIPPSKIEAFLACLVRSGLNPRMIKFWGGEPLVYWKVVRELLPQLAEIYPSARFMLTTNGSLLDDEKIDLFSKYPLTLIISYDGRKSRRDYPIFDDPKIVATVKRAIDKKLLHKLIILPIKYTDSDGPALVKKELTEKLGADIEVCYHGVMRCNITNVQDAEFLSEATKQEIVDYLTKELEKPADQIEWQLLRRVMELRESMVRGIPYDAVDRGFCAQANGRALAVDLNGDILSCQAVPAEITGNLIDLRSVKPTIFFSYQTKKKCMACPYLCACFGTCPRNPENSLAFKLCCNNVTPYYSTLFKYAVQSLLGIKLLSIEPA